MNTSTDLQLDVEQQHPNMLESIQEGAGTGDKEGETLVAVEEQAVTLEKNKLPSSRSLPARKERPTRTYMSLGIMIVTAVVIIGAALGVGTAVSASHNSDAPRPNPNSITYTAEWDSSEGWLDIGSRSGDRAGGTNVDSLVGCQNYCKTLGAEYGVYWENASSCDCYQRFDKLSCPLVSESYTGGACFATRQPDCLDAPDE